MSQTTIVTTIGACEPITTKIARDLVKFDIPGDCSCFLHAVLLASRKSYQEKSDWKSRAEIVTYCRATLALRFTFAEYSKLGNGNTKVLGSMMPEFSYSNLKDNLSLPRYVGDSLLQFVSDQLNLDIYIISKRTDQVYKIPADITLLYKNRPSVILLYDDHQTAKINSNGVMTVEGVGRHYELIGQLRNNGAEVLVYFDYTDPLIVGLKKQLTK